MLVIITCSIFEHFNHNSMFDRSNVVTGGAKFWHTTASVPAPASRLQSAGMNPSLARAIQRLFKIGHQWNEWSELIRDGYRVYVPALGPEEGFRQIDYFHGIGSNKYPIAQMMEDGMDFDVMEMYSAMPRGRLDKVVTNIKQRWIHKRHCSRMLAVMLFEKFGVSDKLPAAISLSYLGR